MKKSKEYILITIGALLVAVAIQLFCMQGMLRSRWVERNPVTYLMGRQAVSKGVTGNGGV